jgi:(1->4)-alpha-D-glucan 1-alpha-D-glucosylmutase
VEELDSEGRDQQFWMAMKFQQLTGPVMAKGLEDTAFYRFFRLSSLNEVGGDPGEFGASVADLHAANLQRQRDWPRALLSSSTHDTKRSEDVRARIDAITELPREWRAAVNRWSRLNRRHKRRVDGEQAPDSIDEYLLYQTLVGAWPLAEAEPSAEFVERIEQYLLKAAREAQRHTSWVNPNADYDEAVSGFVRRVLDPKVSAAFLADLANFRGRADRIGLVNALSMQLLKLTAPGVPDIYQGTELWDLSLVDPDNRRPVDFAERARVARAFARRARVRNMAAELLESAADGRIKLWLTQRCLAARRDHSDLFAGDYVPLKVAGRRATSVIAYARRNGDMEAVVVAPRLVGGLGTEERGWPLGEAAWAGTSIEGLAVPEYTNVLTGQRLTAPGGGLALDGVLSDLPVALLISRGHGAAP